MLTNMLEAWMLEGLDWFKLSIFKAMDRNDEVRLKCATWGEHVDKKGWAFDHTTAQRSLYELFESEIQVELDADGHVYKDFSIRDRREGSAGSKKIFGDGIGGKYFSPSELRRRENHDGRSFFSILKYISSSRLDLLPLLEVAIVDSNIAKIMTTYRMDRKYVVAHLKGCLTLIALQRGLCNTAAAEPYVQDAQTYKLVKNAATKKIRVICGLPT
jgi:hypothetical protein